MDEVAVFVCRGASRSVDMLSPSLFSCVAALLLLQGAQTQNLTLLGTEYSKCELDRLQRNFFHVVTCFGFVRVPLKFQTYESVNAKIDGILEEAKKRREAGGKEVNCSTYSVTPLYYSATELLFVRYPKVHEGDRLKDDERNVSYWIANVAGLDNQFVNFPESQDWTLIRKGYWSDKFYQLSYDKRKNAICDPQYVRHNMRDKKIEFGALPSIRSTLHLDSGKFEATAACAIKRTLIYTRYDPTLVTTERYKPYGFEYAGDRDDSFRTQYYEDHAFESRRDRKDPDQYYYIFGEVDQKSVVDMVAGKRHDFEIVSYCYLRKFRHDLGELNVAYILPQDATTRIITDGDEFITTTTIPTTTLATTEGTTTQPPTTTRKMEAVEEEKKTTTKEADEREYTDPEEEFTPAPVAVGFNSRQELTVSASSSIELGMIVFLFIFVVYHIQ